MRQFFLTRLVRARSGAGGLSALGVALFAALAAWNVSAEQAALPGHEKADVLAIGGAITEIIYALDQEHRLLARDTTSYYPPQARDLPNVGYMRSLSSEGVLAVGPDLILSIEGAGPPETLEVLQAASIEFVSIPEGFTPEAIATKIRLVGAALDVAPKAEALVSEVLAALDTAAADAQTTAATGTPKRVLFLLNAGEGKLMAGGTGTAAEAIITLAGGINAVSAFAGYKPLTDEAAIAAAPDVILMMDRGDDHAMPAETLFALPALALTPAAKTKALLRVDGLKLLGFGPRTAEAVSDLHHALYKK